MEEERGYIGKVFGVPPEERTIKLKDLPPKVINSTYQRKYPILRLVWIRHGSNKLIILEEIELPKENELRLRYYIIGKEDKSRAGRWTFGQYAANMPPDHFKSLVELATLNGMLR